jgi:hypothetical protein
VEVTLELSNGHRLDKFGVHERKHLDLGDTEEKYGCQDNSGERSKEHVESCCWLTGHWQELE